MHKVICHGGRIQRDGLVKTGIICLDVPQANGLRFLEGTQAGTAQLSARRSSHSSASTSEQKSSEEKLFPLFKKC